MSSLVFQIILPFVLSAFIVILVMYVAERYGSKIGGIIGTLPSTIVIAFLFIAYSEGTAFASQAASVVPIELGINVIFLLLFALLIRRSTILAFLASFVVWSILSLALMVCSIQDMVLSFFLYIVTVIVAFVILEKIKKVPSIGNVKVHYTLQKIMLRGVLAGVVIAISVLLSNINAVVSGVFSVFPAILSSTMLISVREHGSDFAAGMAKSMMLGLSSVATYATVIHFFYPLYGIIIGSIVAYIIALCVTIALYTVRSKIS
ncbi:MAG: hypothetical protein V1769_00355 [Thermoplasmatota archaeon]|jgi:hypothetical protein